MNLDDHFNRLESKLDKLDEKVDTKLDRIDEKLDAHLERISKAETSLVWMKWTVTLIISVLSASGAAIADFLINQK